MSFFADMVSHDGHMAFEKCGDVVVSAKDNKLALFCHFCKDLITYLPEFLRHLQEAHSDVFSFTKEHHVYTVEELLSGGEAEEDHNGESFENNSQGGDYEIQQVAEEQDKSITSIDINLPVKIDEEDSRSTRDILAEVENMLLSDEEVTEHDQQHAHEDESQDLAIKAYLKVCQELQEKMEVTEKPTQKTLSPQADTERQRSNGGQTRKEVGLKISQLRSHAIARQSRKRISNVKKRILRSIDNYVSKKRIPFTKESDNQESTYKPLQLTPIRPRKPLSQTPSRPPMNSAHLSVRKSTLTTARISLQMTTTTTSSETVVCGSKGKETAYQVSSQTVVSSSNEEEANCQENEILSLPNRKQKSSPIKIRKIEILPSLNAQHASKDKAKNSEDMDIDEELAKLLQNRAVQASIKTKERTALTENLNGAPRAKKLHNKEMDNPRTKDNAENNLNNLLATRTDSINKQLPDSKMAGQEIEVIIDNGTLLKYVGLPAIYNASYEDKLIFDEVEDLREKAFRFCKIFRNYDGIWNCRKTKPMSNNPQQLAALIELFTKDVNDELGSRLSKTDVKRILNLITLWFWQTVDLKHFKKATLPASTQHYFNLFAFIPHYTRFLFFCEHCDEIFTLEAGYKKHLMSHSLTIRCALCRRTFKAHGFLDKHLRAFHPNDNVLEYI